MKVTICEHVAHRIRDLRTHYNNGEGISQEVLARELKVAANTISRWETAIYRPSLEDLEKLAHFFGVPVNSFLPLDSSQSLDDHQLALLRAVKHLNPEDLEEVIKYAEFRRARSMYKGRTRPRAGRKSQKK